MTPFPPLSRTATIALSSSEEKMIRNGCLEDEVALAGLLWKLKKSLLTTDALLGPGHPPLSTRRVRRVSLSLEELDL